LPSGPEEVLPVGQTVTISFKGSPQTSIVVVHKGADDLSTEDGRVVAYKDVASVTRDVSLMERMLRALIGIPFFLLWALVDFLTVIKGQF
jgi:hypothetical protein